MTDHTQSTEELLLEIKRLSARVRELEAESSQQRQTEKDLMRSRERFRKIFDFSHDAIFLVDPEEDKIMDVNNKACAMLGYDRQELLAIGMSDVHPHEMDNVKVFVDSVNKNGHGWTDDLNCRTKGGRFIPVEISASVFNLEGTRCMACMVRDLSEQARLERENEYLHSEFCKELQFGAIVGVSGSLCNVVNQIELVAPTNASVLILGESGTGKELVARAIHEKSDRKQYPLVRVNCAAIPRELFESEFFGHVKGSFTGAVQDRMGRFQLADGGTIFLDEVGDIPLTLQGKLLRVLQEGEFERVGDPVTHKVNARVLAATNCNLLEEVEAGRFRQDLYYRLSVVPIEILPMRQRKEDIIVLARHFVAQEARRMGIPIPQLSQRQVRSLEAYHWPGNARELQNVISRAMILAKGGRLRFDLGNDGSLSLTPHADPAAIAGVDDDLSMDDLKRMERDVILRAMTRTNWKIYGSDGAAALLDMKPTTLASRLKKMGVVKP